MNRILIGSGNDNISIKKDNTVIINVNKDTSILIKDDLCKEYTFNVINANLNVLIISENNDDVVYNININNGNISFNNVSYNSKNIIINGNLNGENSDILVNNSVISNKKVKCSINIKHNKKITNSEVYNNGITKENGTILFNVCSYAPKNSKNCKINQDSKIISLNDTNENQVNPVLLIEEYETEAKHAAFVGDFNSDKLFYLMSRGLNINDAKNLLINGLLIGTLDICFNEKETLKKRLNEEWR